MFCSDIWLHIFSFLDVSDVERGLSGIPWNSHIEALDLSKKARKAAIVAKLTLGFQTRINSFLRGKCLYKNCATHQFGGMYGVMDTSADASDFLKWFCSRHKQRLWNIAGEAIPILTTQRAHGDMHPRPQFLYR